jgi:hypothetical protein
MTRSSWRLHRSRRGCRRPPSARRGAALTNASGKRPVEADPIRPAPTENLAASACSTSPATRRTVVAPPGARRHWYRLTGDITPPLSIDNGWAEIRLTPSARTTCVTHAAVGLAPRGYRATRRWWIAGKSPIRSFIGLPGAPRRLRRRAAGVPRFHVSTTWRPRHDPGPSAVPACAHLVPSRRALDGPAW